MTLNNYPYYVKGEQCDVMSEFPYSNCEDPTQPCCTWGKANTNNLLCVTDGCVSCQKGPSSNGCCIDSDNAESCATGEFCCKGSDGTDDFYCVTNPADCEINNPILNFVS